jgi:response regulator of citrate/malate metabolism
MPVIKVLIVEDVPEMLTFLSEVISKFENMRVSGTAKNCSEARLEIHRRRPDLVLLDEVLPGESSLDLLSELESEELPVVLMSSMQSPSENLPFGTLRRVSKPDWTSRKAGFDEIRQAILDACKKI